MCVCVCVCVCGQAVETSPHIPCELGALDSHRQTYLVSFFLDLEDIKSLNVRVIGNLTKEQGSLDLVSNYGAQRTCFKA